MWRDQQRYAVQEQNANAEKGKQNISIRSFEA